MRKFTYLLKTLLISALFLGANSAWGDVNVATNCVWLFNQFYQDDVVASITTTDGTRVLVYDFENMYLRVGDPSSGRVRDITATVINMPNEQAPSINDVTPFNKGKYTGLYYNAKSSSFSNTAADAITSHNHNMAAFRVNSEGKLYALVLPSDAGRSVKISHYEDSEMKEKATVTRTVESGANWLLISCDVTSGRYFIGSQDGPWTLFAIKYMPNTDKDARKKFSVNMSQGYATFSSCTNFAVPAGYKAYKAQVSGTDAVLTEISNIPANTGVILTGEAVASLELSSKTSASADVSGNDLIANIGSYALPSNGTITGTTYYNYTLAAGPTFMHSSGEGALAAGKAFLRTTVNVTGGGAKSLRIIVDGDEATGVEVPAVAEVEEDEVLYNMAGLRVGKDYKGIVINQKGVKRFNK